MAKRKSQHILRNILISVVAVVVLGALSYVLVIRPLQVRSQKNDFKKAEAYVSGMADKIQKIAGKADAVEAKNSCDYTSQAYFKGARSCTVSWYILYKNQDELTANKLMTSMSQVEKLPVKSLLSEGPSNFQDISVGKSQSMYQDSSQTFGKITCGIQYSYPAWSFLDSPIKLDGSINSLLVITSCSGLSDSEFYPLN